jgi:hypothetical protein
MLEMLIESLKIEGYRGFKSYQVDGLARVNLLVGRNGSGKTTVLEALKLLVAGGGTKDLFAFAEARGEITTASRSIHDSEEPKSHWALLSPLFYGYEPGDGSTWQIQCPNRSLLTQGRLELSELSGIEDGMVDRATTAGQAKPVRSPEWWFAITSTLRNGSHQHSEWNVLWLDDPLLPTPPLTAASTQRAAPFNSVLLNSQEAGGTELRRRWDRISASGAESAAVEIMQVVWPGITSVYFQSVPSELSNLSGAGILAGIKGEKERRPIGSLGEGVVRALSLAAALTDAEGGVLLVDEIGAGIHYSVQGALWHMLVLKAKELDVQIFATTHSRDCIHGLAWVCDNYPELADQIAVHKIDAGLPQSIRFDSENILTAAQQDIEIR